MRAFLIVVGLIGFVVLMIFALGWGRFFRRRGTSEVQAVKPKGKTTGYWVGAFAALFVVVITSFIRLVPVGHGLVVFWIIPKTYSVAREGITLIPPIISQTTLYDLRRIDYTMSSVSSEGRVQGASDALWAPTSEGLQVGLDLTVWYRVDITEVTEIHRRIGPSFENKVVRPAIRSIVRLTLSSYSIMDIYSNKREEIQNEIEIRLRNMLEPDGIIVDGVAIRNVQFTDEFSRSIEEKQIAQQQAQKMEYVLEQERKEAERKEIEAGGKAKAIRIVSQELRANPNYIKYLYVDKIADDIKVIVSDQATIMDMKGILGN